MKRKGNMDLLITAASEGQPYAEIARAAGVSVATVKRRLQEPEVAREVSQARRQQRREHVGQLSVLATDAIAKLRELIQSDDPQVASRAVGMTLRTVVTLFPQVEIEERLEVLEARLNDQERRVDDAD
jgi:hypothetical protein